MASSTVKKNAKGYGYQYTDISQIHEWLEENGYSYYQYIEPLEGNDYIITVPIIDGKEQPPRRGCKVIVASLSGKSNPAQEQGSGLTYARRYSLLMAFGLATSDDDAACMTVPKDSKPTKNIPSEEEMEKLENTKISGLKVDALTNRCKQDNVKDDLILKKCNVKKLTDLTEKQFSWILANWSKEFKNGV